MDIADIIAPVFYPLHDHIKHNRYTHYLLGGGRASTKSSVIAIEIIQGMLRNPDANAVALRKVKDTCRESVFAQLLWAIDILGLQNYWTIGVSPLLLTYKPTGQMIIFRGADKPRKLKSAKLRRGYLKFIWYEELDEFNGMEDIRTCNQTFMRGGDAFTVFYSYNPPKSSGNWVNGEAGLTRPDRYTLHSTYLDVPKEWLGEAFITEAEHLKNTKPDAYNHEYLGVITGTGTEVFANVVLESLSDSQIAAFDNIYRGIDFGYATDPAAYVCAQYNAAQRTLYIYHEVVAQRMSNSLLASKIKEENKLNQVVVCDSAEPKSIDDLKDMGIRAIGCKKWQGSVETGLKWLSAEVDKIVIDPRRCPVTAKEIRGYITVNDRFPDQDNHTIDALRYALQDRIMNKNRVDGSLQVQPKMRQTGRVFR